MMSCGHWWLGRWPIEPHQAFRPDFLNDPGRFFPGFPGFSWLFPGFPGNSRFYFQILIQAGVAILSIHAKRWLVVGAGLAAILLGVWRQDMLLMWRKAINLCLGCIGIG